MKARLAVCALVCLGLFSTACRNPQPPTRETAPDLAAAPVPTRAAAAPADNAPLTPETAFAEIAIPSPAPKATGATGEITEFPLAAVASAPAGIAVGVDGNVWLAETVGNAIAKVTPEGVVTQYPLKAGALPSAVTAGPDGNIWFAQRGGVGRITSQGTVTLFAVDGIPTGIMPGPDGNVWFTENFRGAIGQVAVPGGADFVTWQHGVTTSSASYTPTAGQGLYRFRTRLRHQTTQGGSDWSPVASITVR